MRLPTRGTIDSAGARTLLVTVLVFAASVAWLMADRNAALYLTAPMRPTASAAERLERAPQPGADTGQLGTAGATGPAGRAAEYLGSAACRRCHESEYARWQQSLHVQMTRPVADARVLGDFRPGTRLEENGRAYTMEQRDGKRFISVSRGGRPAEAFEVHYTLGARRYQGYLSRLPDGRIYVLPIFWHVETGHWVDWKEITPVPDGDHDLRQIWNVTCFNCHATNLVKNFDPAGNTYKTTWTEMGVACEACHGPGRQHADLMTAWEIDPASKPEYDRRSSNRDLGQILRIFSPRSAERRQVFDSCGYCHGNKNNFFVGFSPGDRYEDYALPFLVSQPIPSNDPQGDFWPDGRPSRFNRPQALMSSGCFLKGQAVCINCHAGHGSKNDHALRLPVETSNGLCTQCHKTFTAGEAVASFDGPELARHTHHPPASTGSRCIECHMSDVNWRLLTRRRDHTFKPPVPEMTARYGVPNGCTTCHDDRTPEWAATIMDGWYGSRERRQAVVATADAMYEAGAGNRAAVPELLKVLADRGQGPVMRASAAEFLGQLIAANATGAPATGGRASGGTQTSFLGGNPAHTNRPAGTSPTATAKPPLDAGVPPVRIVNSLIGAAADPEPMVRALAVRSLGIAGDRRALSPLVARLVDPVRLVRTNAAEALLHLGVASLDGPAGQALARAQDEYADRLRTFQDEPVDHTTLAWLQMERGLVEEARRELAIARRLDPADLRSRVYSGIIAAREGKLDDALREWRAVRQDDPTYPNINLLIEEAQKRAQGQRR